MRYGLVLEGGGLRSLFSEGVFDVMLEHGIYIDGVIGVSAGASFGCNYKSRQVGRALRYNTNFAKDPRYMGIRSLIKTGDIVGGEYAYHIIPTTHDIFDWDEWNRNDTEFYVVATDVASGNAVYKKIKEMNYEGLEWLRASASMPIVSHPVKLEGKEYLDGGIADSIPLRKMQALGYEKNIVILTQPKGYMKKKTKLMPIFKLFCRRYPAIIKAMSVRHTMYNSQLEFLAEQEACGNTLVIAPERPLNIGRLELKPEKMRFVYEMGRKAGEEYLERIKDFLS